MPSNTDTRVPYNLTVYDTRQEETVAAVEYDGDNQTVPVMHAHDLQIVAPADDADAAAAVYRNYPSELTGGTA